MGHVAWNCFQVSSPQTKQRTHWKTYISMRTVHPRRRPSPYHCYTLKRHCCAAPRGPASRGRARPGEALHHENEVMGWTRVNLQCYSSSRSLSGNVSPHGRQKACMDDLIVVILLHGSSARMNDQPEVPNLCTKEPNLCNMENFRKCISNFYYFCEFLILQFSKVEQK
jgi:hypothetical protein